MHPQPEIEPESGEETSVEDQELQRMVTEFVGLGDTALDTVEGVDTSTGEELLMKLVIVLRKNAAIKQFNEKFWKNDSVPLMAKKTLMGANVAGSTVEMTANPAPKVIRQLVKIGVLDMPEGVEDEELRENEQFQMKVAKGLLFVGEFVVPELKIVSIILPFAEKLFDFGDDRLEAFRHRTAPEIARLEAETATSETEVANTEHDVHENVAVATEPFPPHPEENMDQAA